MMPTLEIKTTSKMRSNLIIKANSKMKKASKMLEFRMLSNTTSKQLIRPRLELKVDHYNSFIPHPPTTTNFLKGSRLCRSLRFDFQANANDLTPPSPFPLSALHNNKTQPYPLGRGNHKLNLKSFQAYLG